MGDRTKTNLSLLRSVCLVVAMAVSSPAALGQTGDDGFQRGLAAFEQGDFEGARQFWLPLADAGLAEAQLGMGVLFLDGLGVAQDDARAARWFALAAEQGNAEAQYNIGFLYFLGRGIQQDLQSAQGWFDAAAAQGHAEASYYLGTMYSGGYGAPRDEVVAYAHFERAFTAASGDLKDLAARSRDALGRRLSEADLARARQLAQSASRPAAPQTAATEPGGSYKAGLAAYEAGEYAQALEIWRPLAAGGDGLAQQGLGVLYHDGLGTVQNKGDAARWFALAARQGMAESQYNLGLLLFAGDGVAEDQQAAARWFGLAGDQGHAEANYYLGTVLAGGADGIDRDDEAAYRRFLLANDSDPVPSLAVLIRQGLETVARRLSAEQIARAELTVHAEVSEEAERRVAILGSELEDLRAAEETARNQLAAAQDRATRLVEEAAARRSELTAGQSDLAALEQQVEAIDQQLAGRRTEREKSAAAVRAAEEQAAQSEAALQSEQRDLAQAVRERAAAEERIRALTEQLEAAQAARQAALENEAAAGERAETFQAEVEAQRRLARQSQEELDAIDARLAGSQNAQRQLAARHDQLNARLAELEDASEAARAAELAARAAIRQAAANAHDASQRIAALESEQAAAVEAAAQVQVAADQARDAEPAPSPERTETQIAVAQELQEQAVAAAERDAPPPSTELVSAIQASLGQLGYDAGPADGIFGAKTADAVKQFQAEQGLPETGIVTQELAFLLSLLAEREDEPPPQDLALAGSGTGFIIAGDGYILTNNHVVEGCQEVRIQYDGEAYVVDHVSSDPQADLALLDGDFSADEFVVFRGGRGIRPGEDVVALGYPLQGRLSDQVKVTKGTISALSGPGNDRTLIQTTAPVQAGSSGGPLFDMSGNIVGVVVGKISAVEVENVSFAINGSIARIFLDAEGVRYTTLRSDEALSAADVVERGRRATVLIECWNPAG